jgi:hypothetical protein
LLVLLLASLLAASAQARLGETLGEIKKQFDRPPDQSRKGNAYWLVEGEDGLLFYTVTFNDKGQSIAEGLRPVRRARFTSAKAAEFIALQTDHLRNSKTKRGIALGEKYRFAGQDFVCAQNEQILLDEPNGLLLIWNQSLEPSVVVVSPEMFHQGK